MEWNRVNGVDRVEWSGMEWVETSDESSSGWREWSGMESDRVESNGMME